MYYLANFSNRPCLLSFDRRSYDIANNGNIYCVWGGEVGGVGSMLGVRGQAKND